MPDDIGSVACRWQRRRRPDFAGLFIPKIEGFTAEISDGIVIPWRKPKFMRILGPGISAAGLRDDRPEIWICQNVNPRSGRSDSRASS